MSDNNKGGKTKAYKSVYFNLNNAQDKIILEYVNKKRSFSTFVKEILYQEMSNQPSDINPYDYETTDKSIIESREAIKSIPSQDENQEVAELVKQLLEIVQVSDDNSSKRDSVIDVIQNYGKSEEEIKHDDREAESDDVAKSRREDMADNFIKNFGKK